MRYCCVLCDCYHRRLVDRLPHSLWLPCLLSSMSPVLFHCRSRVIQHSQLPLIVLSIDLQDICCLAYGLHYRQQSVQILAKGYRERHFYPGSKSLSQDLCATFARPLHHCTSTRVVHHSSSCFFCVKSHYCKSSFQRKVYTPRHCTQHLQPVTHCCSPHCTLTGYISSYACDPFVHHHVKVFYLSLTVQQTEYVLHMVSSFSYRLCE